MKNNININIGCLNSEQKRIAKPLISLIVSYQKKLQEEENKRKKYKPRKISFIYASLELSRRLDK